jgi:uncharacterized protein YyaL (SSP411 family)
MIARNLLGQETSPYLLQHKDNPVHWRPWGDAALTEAKAQNKPILLSVGYAACHWCHVMAHESFEDQATADLMNAHFINIKVDREERPDVDRIYMDSLHALGEQGGWPLTMFLTPEGEPFWGGTYFPKEARYGRASFKHVLNEIARIWRDERDKVRTNSEALRAHLTTLPSRTPGAELAPSHLESAALAFLKAIDMTHGGIRGVPKFPQGPIFSFLWTMARRMRNDDLNAAVATTLTNMLQGGIYDHLAGGMARYSVDHRWLVPHFEKMLYDNAQLVSLLARVCAVAANPLFERRLQETVDFVLSEMRADGGAFAASYDADSEGEEGKYYVWSRREIDEVLGGSAQAFCEAYDVTEEGNFEGHNILNRLHAKDDASDSFASERRKLLEWRRQRIPPGFDDKVLADWNGLMIAALAEAALVRRNADWAAAARQALVSVLAKLWDGHQLRQSWRAGETRHFATADGYANLIAACLRLHALTAAPDVLDTARELADSLIAHHWNAAAGALSFASQETELIVKPCFGHDDATPNANAVMQSNFTRLALLTGHGLYEDKARAIHETFAAQAAANPFGYATFLEASLDLGDLVQVIVAGSDSGALASPLLARVVQSIGPDCLIGHVASASELPANHPAARKEAPGGKERLYLCRGQTCAMPAVTQAEIDSALAMLELNRLSTPSP